MGVAGTPAAPPGGRLGSGCWGGGAPAFPWLARQASASHSSGAGKSGVSVSAASASAAASLPGFQMTVRCPHVPEKGAGERKASSLVSLLIRASSHHDPTTPGPRVSAYRFGGHTSVESIAGALSLAVRPRYPPPGPCGQVPMCRGSGPFTAFPAGLGCRFSLRWSDGKNTPRPSRCHQLPEGSRHPVLLGRW